MNRPRKRDRHLPANVYFKHGRHWYVKGGKWRPLSADVGTALREYADIVAAPKGGMDALIDRALEQMRPRLARSTIDQYEIAARILKKELRAFAPEQVRPKHVAAIKVHHAKTPNMANRILSFLRSVFNLAVEWQLVESNPCIGIRRHEEAKRGRYLTDAEYRAIKAVAHPRLAAIMDVAYYTAQRIGDVLRIRAIDITDAGIAFQQQKTGARLVVRMTPELREAVQRAKAVAGENVRAMTLFHIRGRVPSYGGTRDLLDRATALANIEDVGLHDIRAKALTDAKRQGKDPQALGGHLDKRTTDRYIRQREIPQVEGPSFGQSIDSAEKTA